MKKSYTIKILLALAIIIGIFLGIRQTELYSMFIHQKFGISELRDYLLSFGDGALLVLMLIYTVKPLLVITPISVVAIVTGLMYGPWIGTLYTLIGSFLSASSGFFIARFLGQGIVDKILRGKKTKIEGDIEKHGMKIMFSLRLAFVFPYDPLSYAAGLSKMKYRHFIIGTIIGVIPEMFAYNYLGTSIDSKISIKSIMALIVVILFGVLSIINKRKKNANNN